MGNIGAGEILVIGLVALIVVGPEQLPSLIRRVGQVIGQVRSVTDNLKKDFMDTVDESGDLKKTLDPKSWTAGSGTDDDPVVPRGLADSTRDEQDAAAAAVEPDKDVQDALAASAKSDDEDQS